MFACVFVSLVVRVGLAGVPAGVLGASDTPIFASPGVGSVVFVCASLALAFNPVPAWPRTSAHFSLALLVLACVFVSLVVRVRLAGVPAVTPAAPGTLVFASPGVGSVVFVCASLALAFSPAPAVPRTSAHLSLALLVFACVFVSLAVRVGLAGVPVVSWCASGTPIFASPGVGSVVFVCASLALCLL